MEAEGAPQIVILGFIDLKKIVHSQIHAVNDEVRNLRHSPRYYKVENLRPDRTLKPDII